jgi:chromate transporter
MKTESLRASADAEGVAAIRSRPINSRSSLSQDTGDGTKCGSSPAASVRELISPGPVVITATFVGYLVGGFWGSVISTVGIFLPSFLLVLIAAPLLARHRANPNVQGFVKGAYAAAIGTILGACILLGKIAIGDWLTLLIGVVSLAILFRWKVSNPLLIAGTAVVGLIAFPLLQPTWVMVQ